MPEQRYIDLVSNIAREKGIAPELLLGIWQAESGQAVTMGNGESERKSKTGVRIPPSPRIS